MRYFVGFMLVLTISLSLVSCSYARQKFPTTTRVNPPELPAYPSVVQPIIETEKDFYGMKEQIISFKTTDSPDTILEFYREQLMQQHWMDPIQSNNELKLINREACPIYMLRITTKATGTLTDVVVDLTPGACKSAG